MAGTVSMLEVDVVPTVATTQNGFFPAARSVSIARSSASGRIRNSASTGIARTFSWPIPNVIAPFSTDECDCADVYKVRLPSDPRRRASGSAISRAAAIACMVLVEAVS